MNLRPSRSPLRGLATLTALPLVLGLAACGDVGGSASEGADADSERLSVLVSFYPIEHLTSRVAGEHADITTLTSPGVDPHDVELTPRQVASVGSADLVLYTSNMQPAVDQAVQAEAGDRAVDLSPHADLLTMGEAVHEHDDDHEHEGDHEDSHVHDDDHEHADADDHDGHDHGTEDPHFWLDPERYGQVARGIADELISLDPDNTTDYEANLELLLSDLEALDQEFTEGLAQCRSRELVTTHEAFGYLAHRYDLHQIGITGIAPESEPSPARLAEVTAQVSELGVGAIFAEPILTDAIARTVANETDADVLVLDPIEGITDASAGTDYAEIMRANLDALREGLDCS